MTMQDLLDHFETQTAIAKALGTSVQVVSSWKAKKRIPLGRQYEIQVLTCGKLRADPSHAASQDGAAA
jgi:transcriptional repressor of cell division inhibition gene dicB